MSSYGQSLLREYAVLMINSEIVDDYRPEWLFGMELDLFFPKLGFALEFQGDQHFVPTDFGSPVAQKRRDRRKRQICAEKGVILKIVDASHLEWSCLRGKLTEIPTKYWFKLDSTLKKKLTAINCKCANYRHAISTSYGAITAHRIGSKVRRQKTLLKWT